MSIENKTDMFGYVPLVNYQRTTCISTLTIILKTMRGLSGMKLYYGPASFEERMNTHNNVKFIFSFQVVSLGQAMLA